MLIDCAIYQKGRRHLEVSPENIYDHLNFIEDSKDFVWAAYADPVPGELEKLAKMLGVHDLALEDVTHGSQLPKFEEYDEHVFIVMKHLSLKNQEVEEGDVYIFAGPHYVITVRKNCSMGFGNVRKRSERERKLLSLGPSYVVYSIMDTIVDRYFPVITKLEKEMDALENVLFKDEDIADKGNIIKNFHTIKEKSRACKAVVMPAQEFLMKLFGGRVPELFEDMDNYFRDIHDHLLRITGILDAVHDTASSGIHTSVALIAIEDSKVTKKLASWAAIFGASTLMAGIWGMNFTNMPELQWKYGYIVGLGSIAFVALILYRKFKKSGWM